MARSRAPSRPLPGMAALAAQGLPPVRGKSTKPKVDYPGQLRGQIRAMGLPVPDREVTFHPVRRWRFDLAFRDRMLAVEVDGGAFVQGRHGRGVGMDADCEKYSEAAILGWRIMRFTPRMIKDGTALRMVWRALGGAAAYRD